MEKKLGEQIRKVRKDKHITQEELAKASGISVMSIRRYESGVREPSISTLNKISTILKFDFNRNNAASILIAQYLENENLSPEKLAEKCDIPLSNILEILKNQNLVISVTTAKKIARIINCKVSALLNLNDISASLYDEMELELEDIKKVIENLKSKGMESVTYLDSDGNPFTTNDYIEKPDIDNMEYKLFETEKNIDEFLDMHNIPLKPGKHPSLSLYLSQLNEDGVEEASKRIEELTHLEKYRKK